MSEGVLKRRQARKFSNLSPPKDFVGLNRFGRLITHVPLMRSLLPRLRLQSQLILSRQPNMPSDHSIMGVDVE
jgi:hypothetical protein